MRRSRKTGVLAGLVALGAAAAGCATSPALVVPQTPVEIREPTAVAASLPSTCGEAIPGWRAFSKPGRIVLLGEQHGSKEIPAFVGDAACQSAASGLAVHVALEIAQFEQPLVDRYLASQGTHEDREQLLNGGMWHRMYEDGRSSKAMVELIERMRVLRHQGFSIHVHYYDGGGSGNEREAFLAANVLRLWNAAPRDLYLVLTGNIHARTVVGVEWDATLEPMGYLLTKSAPDVVALDHHYSRGEIWACNFSRWGRRIKCGPHMVAPPHRVLRERDLPLSADGQPVERFAGKWEGASPEGFHGIFYVGQLTPAEPAVQVAPVASR